jgi:hypothetical protein
MKKLTGLFLGAGASFEAGMPLAWELTAEIKNWLTADKLRKLNAGWRAQGSGHSDVVIEDLASVLERPAMHYEAILGYMEAQFRRQHALRQEYHSLYSWLVELVYHLLYVRQVSNDTFFKRHLSAYDGFRVLADANTPLWVFSLNHDVIMEAIAARLSIPIHCGFSSSTVNFARRDASGQKIGDIRAEVLTKHDLEHGAMYFPNPPQPGIYLLKIHGALDIFTFNDGQDLLKLLPDAPGQDGVMDVLRAANEGLFYEIPGAPGGRAKALNEICYPDNNGVMQFLRKSLLAGAFKFDARGHQVLPKSMLKHFRENLNFVTTLVCIGYGFGDLHINVVLREWLEFSADRRLEIVSPDARDVPPFLLHLSPQVLITASGATEYLDSRADIIRSRQEILEKRVGTILRSLGKERADKVIAAFHRAERDRAGRGLLAKLRSLPVVDGKPDVSGLSDPTETAKQWAAELKVTPEEFLQRLLEHLDEKRTN